MKSDKYSMTELVESLLEDAHIEQLLNEYEHISQKPVEADEVTRKRMEKLMGHYGFGASCSQTIKKSPDSVFYEIPLLAASSIASEQVTPWWQFNTIINDIFRVAVYQSDSPWESEDVYLEFTPIPGKEDQFIDHFSEYKGKKRGVKICWGLNRKQVVIEGEIVHSFDGSSVTGKGTLISSKVVNEPAVQLMLELHPVQ